MRRKAAEFVFLLLCICLIKGTVCSAAMQVAAGSCGENVTWTLDDENVLSISGTGKISGRPWEKFMQWKKIEKYPSPRDYEYDIEEDDPHFVTVVIKKGITGIGANIFSSPYIKKVILPDGMTEIGASAFKYSSIQSLDIPDSVVEIGSGAFACCRQLAGVHLPESLTRIRGQMFCECIALKDVTIPDCVKEIEKMAFNGASNLEKITFGKSLTTIPDQLFTGCQRLRKIVNHSNTRFSLSGIGAETEVVTWHEKDAIIWEESDFNNRKAYKEYWKKRVDYGVDITDILPGKTVVGYGKEYKIHYVAMKGVKVKGKLPKSFRYGKSINLPSKVTKKGYLFVGWNISDGYGKWDALRTDSNGEIYFNGLTECVKDTERKYICKMTPCFIKVKVKKKAKKTIVQVDCRNLPKKGMTSADVAIRYSYNKKMKKFKVSCKSKYMKKVYFALPKSFGDCKGYMQFAMVDDNCNYFMDFYKKAGWEIVGRSRSWIWSKIVVSKGK